MSTGSIDRRDEQRQKLEWDTRAACGLRQPRRGLELGTGSGIAKGCSVTTRRPSKQPTHCSARRIVSRDTFRSMHRRRGLASRKSDAMIAASLIDVLAPDYECEPA
jgi:hypothetical protein